MTLIIYKETEMVEKNKFTSASELLMALSEYGVIIELKEASKMIEMGGSHIFGYENQDVLGDLARIAWNKQEIA